MESNTTVTMRGATHMGFQLRLDCTSKSICSDHG
jgi:hypothetical protein